MGFKFQSLEILSYDPSSQIFPAHVYSSMESTPRLYYWDAQGDTITHWTEGSKYTGTFSSDGNTLAGGWRATDGEHNENAANYDAVMIRVENK